MTLFTVDVSNHDRNRKGGPLDWRAIKAAGIVASCAKASEGDDPATANYSYTDPWFRENTDGAARAGIPFVGAYHVLSAGTSASITRQVNWLRRSVLADMWAMVDVEPFEELKSRSIAPKWVDVKDFCTIWTSLTRGRPLGVYLPQWYWSPAVADGGLGKPDLRVLPGNCFLVSSDYGPNAISSPAGLYGQRNGDTGRGWAAYGGAIPRLWQFGSQAQVPGASPATDVNAFRGDLAGLHDLLYGKGNSMTQALSSSQDGALGVAYQGAHALIHGDVTTVGAGANAEPSGAPVYLTETLNKILTKVTGDPGVHTMTPAETDALATAIAGKLSTTLAADLASAVADKLRDRLQA